MPFLVIWSLKSVVQEHRCTVVVIRCIPSYFCISDGDPDASPRSQRPLGKGGSVFINGLHTATLAQLYVWNHYLVCRGVLRIFTVIWKME